MTSRWDPSRAGLDTLEQALIGASDQINNALAVVLLNMQYVDDALDTIDDSSITGIIGDIMSGLGRIRDVVRDLGAVGGTVPVAPEVDVGHVLAALLRLTRGDGAIASMGDRVAVDARCQGPRFAVVAALALCLGEIAPRLADGSLPPLSVAVERGGAMVAVRFDAPSPTTSERLALAAALVADMGGELIFTRGGAGAASIEIRLPSIGAPEDDGGRGRPGGGDVDAGPKASESGRR